MNPTLYNLTSAAALAALVAGSVGKYGWEVGAMVGGGVALAINLITLIRLTGPR